MLFSVVLALFYCAFYTKTGHKLLSQGGAAVGFLKPDRLPRPSTNEQSRKRKHILIYTPLFGSVPWKDVPYDYNFTDSDGSSCAVNQCSITYNKEDLPQSDVVLFHGRDLPSAEHLRNILFSKIPRSQSWVYFMHESPVYTLTNFSPYRGIFNWTSSYRSDADILVTYHFYRPLKTADPVPEMSNNFAAGSITLNFNTIQKAI